MKFGVCILSNYKEDEQQSMLQYADLLETTLKKKGVSCMRIEPENYLGSLISFKQINKYLRYIDKYFFFKIQLRKLYKELQKDQRLWIVHIVDHSNALYVDWIEDLPVIVTCHDVGAIQGARGELDDCPASFFGKILQNKILSGLLQATHCVTVSEYTKRNLCRLSSLASSVQIDLKCSVILNPIPIGLVKITKSDELKNQFERIFKGNKSDRYLLNVGSNLRRKNRDVVLKVFAEWSKENSGFLVFVGDRLSSQLLASAKKLGILDKIIDLGKVSSPMLVEIYQNAFALLFPSRFEGFGWPIIEGQVMGIPVIAGKNSAIPEIAGNGAFLCDSEDIQLMVKELSALKHPEYRAERIHLGYQNLEKFNINHFENNYINLYKDVACNYRKQRVRQIKFQANDANNLKTIKIAGFGACMMGGYPFSSDASFYHHAIYALSRDLPSLKIEERNCTINGCSLIQSFTYLEDVFYSNKPDILIVQFGGVDASISIRTKLSFGLFRKRGTSKLFNLLKLEQRLGGWHILKWKILGIISTLLCLKPFTPIELYLETFLKVVNECKSRGIAVIAVTPFRMGNSRSDHFAKLFSEAIEKASQEQSFHCLNSWKTLSTSPIEKILLIDGFHLTLYAHEILGKALNQKVKSLASQLKDR